MNEELIELRNRLLIGIVIVLVFCTPLLFVFINKFGAKPSKILKAISDEKSVVILTVEDDCSKCQKTENILKENAVSYLVLNKDRDLRYKEILTKLNFSESEIKSPTVIYLEKGKLHSSYVNPTSDELLSFIDYNELSSSK